MRRGNLDEAFVGVDPHGQASRPFETVDGDIKHPTGDFDGFRISIKRLSSQMGLRND